MKIIFLTDEQEKKIPDKVYGCSYTLYPTPDLATLYNAAVLKKAGHSVALHRVKNINKPLPQADIYLINSVILSFTSDLKLSQKLRKKTLFFFGPYPTLYPEKYLKYENHFVLRGETEHFIAKAILNPKKSLGVTYKTKNGIRNNKTAGIITNLDSIPFPLREIDEGKYYNPKLNLKKFTNVLGSRGCANRCYFCVPNSLSWARELEWKKTHKEKPPVTIRSAKNILKEMEILKKEGYEEFSFIDDQFAVVKERMLKLSKGLKKLKIHFGALARADRLHDKEMIKALSQAGCVYIDLGVESFDQEILDDIKKDVKVETVLETIKWLNQYKIDPKLNIMFGTSPKENEEKIRQTIEQTLKLPVSTCMFSIATPFPGTELAKIATKKKWVIKTQSINPASHALISYPHLSNEKLEKINVIANRRFYLRGKIILKQLKKIKNFSQLKKSVILLKNYLRNFIS